MEKRRCACGAFLNQYNPDAVCGPCEFAGRRDRLRRQQREDARELEEKKIRDALRYRKIRAAAGGKDRPNRREY